MRVEVSCLRSYNLGDSPSSMQIHIPFTNVKIAVGLLPETARARSFSRGKFAAEPERDMDGFKLDPSSLFTAWRNNADVAGCVREIRQGVGIGGIYFYDPNDPKKEKPASDTLQKRMLGVLSYQYGSPREFINRCMEPRLICGNPYFEKVRSEFDGSLLGHKAVDPRTVAIVTDEHGTVYRYIQTAFSGDGMLSRDDSVVFEPNEIIHWKLGQDPNAEAFGMSPMEHVLWEARTDLSAMISNYFFFENDAVPSVWYMLDDDLDEDERKNALAAIRKSFQGARKRHKSAVMSGVKDIKTVRLNNKDMEFLNGRKFTTEKICAAYGVPKVMLGYTEGVNYTNHEGQRENFHEGTVKEHEEAFLQMVNEEIVPEIEEGAEDKIAIGFMPARLESQGTLFDRAIRSREAGLVTINGGRRMIGREPIDESLHGNLGNQIILGQGANAVLLTDVGIDPVDGFFNDQQKLADLLAKYESQAVHKGE